VQRRKRHIWPTAVTIGSLRRLNTYESTGFFEGKLSTLDELILEHLFTQQELSKLDAREETIAEGYTRSDIALELGCSEATVRREMGRVKWALMGAAHLENGSCELI